MNWMKIVVVGLVAVGLICAADVTQAAVVGLNFVGGGPSPGTLAAGDTAGAPGLTQSNWNNLATNYHGSAGAVPSSLVDSAGTTVGSGNNSSVGMRVEYDSGTVWGTGIADTGPDSRLMRGYLDDHPSLSSQPYMNLRNIPYQRYNIVVYVDGDATSGTDGGYWLETLTPVAGTQLTSKVYAAESGHFSGTYTQVPVTSTKASPSTGNYIVFEGLDQLDIRLRGQKESGTRAPINGVQLVDASGPVELSPFHTIGLNFVGSGGSVAPSEVAGASGRAQVNWNNLNTDYHGNGGAVPGTVVDNSGLVVGVGNQLANGLRVEYDAANVWGTAISPTSPDQRLMKGYLDSSGIGSSQPYVRLLNMPYALYDVVLYVDGDGTNGELGEYWIEDTGGNALTPHIFGRDMYNFNGRFTQVPTSSTVQGSAPIGNYIVFRSLTAADIVVRGSQISGTRSPINAIQLIETPEPGTMTLLGLGSVVALIRRRRRRA